MVDGHSYIILVTVIYISSKLVIPFATEMVTRYI